jgi:type II secretory ATPase GspE/PulE/Tfp pilus assembly ATPase PilB-like protein
MARPSSIIKQVVSTSQQESEEIEARMQAQSLNLGYVNLKTSPIQVEVLHFLGDEVSQKYRLIPYLQMGKTVRLATDQYNQNLKPVLEKIGQDKQASFQVVLASQSSIEHGLDLLIKTRDLYLKAEPEKIVISETQIKQAVQSLAALQTAIQQTPTTQLLELVLAGALGTRASDIHISPQKTGAILRLRIDGALQVVTVLNQESYKGLDSRIKFLAKLELSRGDTPQDGSFSFKYGATDLDIRVSTLPTEYGESFVLRVLEETPQSFQLSQLGFSKEMESQIREAIMRPNGLILNTGPTGSGKTTTLYSILNILNKPERNIITIEDPVEYKLPGIEQIPVTDKVDFKTGLRSILRHDPDTIMVGEIRDRETASIAIQASLTGHLVLSTLHTNNAAGAFVRFVDLEVEPFLLIGNVVLVIAQRLVRRICPYCRAKVKVTSEQNALYQKYFRVKEVPSELVRGQGCIYCHGTGFLGRVVIAEAIKPSPDLNQILQNKPDANAIQTVAIKNGMKPMVLDGWEKVLAGITVPEEVIEKTSF